MKFTRKFVLAAFTTLAVMACVGAMSASASATTTGLCNEHVDLECPEGSETNSVHLALGEGAIGRILSSLVTILCLGILVEATPLVLSNPQSVHILSSSYTGCGTGSAHSNCTATVLEQPLVSILKTGLDQGSLTASSGRTRLVCSNLGIDCEYDLEGILFAVGSQHLTANETTVTELGGKFFCPDTGKLDGLLKILHTSLPSFKQPPLCKTHTSECPEKDQIKSLHLATTQASVLYNTVASIECESSLAKATVLGAVEPQKLDTTELTWKDCHTQGAADNCTVTSKALPTIDLERTALNLGAATALGLKVGIDCLVLGLIELDCAYGSDVALQFEGALHKEGTGHGMLTASKVVLKKTEGGGHCPESVKWDALYELSEHAYIGPLKEEKGGGGIEGGTYILQ